MPAISTTSRRLDTEEEWKIAWISDHLGWPGEHERLGRSRIFKFPGGQKVYFENRNRNQVNHYWVRISVKKYQAVKSNAGFAHVIFIDNDTRAIMLSDDAVRRLLDFMTKHQMATLDLAIYPDDEFRVRGGEYGDNWAPFVVDVGLISDPLHYRRVALAFPAPNRPPRGQETAAVTLEQSRRIKRSIAVISWVLRQAAGKCEACCQSAPFHDEEGHPFLEVHHLTTLANGGRDKVDNAVAVCPNCHRELHYGQNANRLRNDLIRRIGRLRG